MIQLESTRVREAFSDLVSEISHRRTLFSLTRETEKVELMNELERTAEIIVKVVDKYDVLRLLKRVMNDSRIDDALKAKFVCLSAAVLEK